MRLDWHVRDKCDPEFAQSSSDLRLLHGPLARARRERADLSRQSREGTPPRVGHSAAQATGAVQEIRQLKRLIKPELEEHKKTEMESIVLRLGIIPFQLVAVRHQQQRIP